MPVDEHIDLIPYNSRKPIANIKKIYDIKQFPKADRAKPRLLRIKITKFLTDLISGINFKLPPIPSDHEQYLKQVYPFFFKKAQQKVQGVVWREPPQIPPEILKSQDLLATVAVVGPLADYIKKITPDEIKRINSIQENHVDEEAYTIALEEFSKYPVKEGLLPIGCTVIFKYNKQKQQLETQSILYQDSLFTPLDELWNLLQKVALCTLSTHLGIIKHNIYIHLIYVTDFTAITINKLKPEHPIRRLLHHCFQTALIGNYEISQLQIRGESSYCTRVFSYDYDTMIEMINEFCDYFDIRQMDPMLDAFRRGMDKPNFAYPFLENIKPLWSIIDNYVNKFVDHYYKDDVQDDLQLLDWYNTLDQYIPNGIKAYVPTLNKDAVKKLCASFIYTSTVTHDTVNNVVWNYTALNQYIPTVVPSNCELPPINIAFDFVTTLIGTWKPFNMLLDGISEVAPDKEGKQIMDEFVAALKQKQQQMSNEPFTYDKNFPKNLNYSVSN
jgi:arachidonate 15-lipoxygenase